MTEFFSTTQVSQILKIKRTDLSNAIRDGVLSKPQKSPTGQFLWIVDDIERAAWVMHKFKTFQEWRADKQ